MTEQCSCGALFSSRIYKRVLLWRHTHRHPEDSPQGAESTTELSDQYDDSAIVRIGFRPNA